MAKKKVWFNVGVGILLSAVSFAGAMAITNAKDEEKSELKASDYGIFRLDDAGKKVDGDTGITTKEFYELANLESIKVGEDSVTYYVNVYDKDKKLISVTKYTDSLTAEDIQGYKDAGGVYFKLELVDPSDDKISIFEKAELSKRLTVTFTDAQEADEKTEESETDDTTEV